MTHFPVIHPAIKLVAPHTVRPIVNPIILIIDTVNILPVRYRIVNKMGGACGI